MPSRSCRPSLVNNMAVSSEGRSEDSVPTMKSPSRGRHSKRKCLPDLEGPPVKLARKASADSECDEYIFSPTRGSVSGSKSFYGGTQSRYLSPLDRKEITAIKGGKTNTSLPDVAIEAKKENIPKKPQQARPKSKAMKRKGKVEKTPLAAETVQAADEEEDDVTGHKKFFKNRRSPSSKAVSSAVVTGKGFALSFNPGKLGKDKKKELTPKLTEKCGKVLPSHTVSSIAALAMSIGKNAEKKLAASPVRRSPRKAAQNGARKPFVNPFSQDLFDDSQDTPSTPEYWRITVNGVASPKLRSQPRRNADSVVCTEERTPSVDDGASSAADSVLLLSEGTPRNSPLPSREATPLLFDSDSKDSTPKKSEPSSSSSSPVPGSPLTRSAAAAAGKLKMFPIFTRTPPQSPASSSLVSSEAGTPDLGRKHSRRSCRTSPKQTKSKILRKTVDKDGREQMTLDAGQKLIGAVHCTTCGMTYTHAEPTDEATHLKFHQRMFNVLKFQGYKKERTAQEFLDGSRIVIIMPEDKLAMKKVEAVKQVMDEDLGFVVESRPVQANSKTYLFVSADKRIVGCCIAQIISRGYRVVTDSEMRDSQSSAAPDKVRPWCCSNKPERARCGISRIWVPSGERRSGVATKLIDSVRGTFLMGRPLQKSDLAFSDPTPDGKLFATRYTGTPNFLVYKQ